MENTLYVSNLAENINQDQLVEIFEQYGQVSSVTFGINEVFKTPYALVTLTNEKSMRQAMHSLNGHWIEGKPLTISFPDIIDYSRGLSAKQRETAEMICKELEEHIRKPVRRIHTIILLCGHSFALSLLKEAKEIYAGEGMLIKDGSRKRSVGGIFFQLANQRMAVPLFHLIHRRGGKLPDYQPEDDALINHLVSNPKIF